MYLIMLTLGEDHPEMSNVDFNIGLLLSNAGHYEESQAYLESARRLQNKFHGSQSITVATIHHLLANSLTHIGAFAEAKQNKRKAYNIYRTKFGPDHARTVQSFKKHEVYH
ncbi:PREDICTED: clustered mitochondria protein homolog [Amphimedon queenslandica]|uniref:Kinesin light chain n=2 Tax=Amphimedon queenslandica TaxID=400682 RepID=A0AAN0K499_AMPQE|nr:PREDICTED: clustered mitochondria protein homolog [Amphimedon queenslandica]|eukprot:XP_019864142.1 PREDICTED: clustered mitochondria protein homolog [Amphimedon queenslandica]